MSRSWVRVGTLRQPAPRVVAQPKSYDVRRVTAALVRKPFRSLKKNPFRTDALIFPSEKSSKATGCRESRSLAGDASMAKNSRSELLSQAHLKFSQKPFEKKNSNFSIIRAKYPKDHHKNGPDLFQGKYTPLNPTKTSPQFRL